jgi:hypothetical protein
MRFEDTIKRYMKRFNCSRSEACSILGKRKKKKVKLNLTPIKRERQREMKLFNDYY